MQLSSDRLDLLFMDLKKTIKILNGVKIDKVFQAERTSLLVTRPLNRQFFLNLNSETTALQKISTAIYQSDKDIARHQVIINLPSLERKEGNPTVHPFKGPVEELPAESTSINYLKLYKDIFKLNPSFFDAICLFQQAIFADSQNLFLAVDYNQRVLKQNLLDNRRGTYYVYGDSEKIIIAERRIFSFCNEKKMDECDNNTTKLYNITTGFCLYKKNKDAYSGVCIHKIDEFETLEQFRQWENEDLNLWKDKKITIQSQSGQKIIQIKKEANKNTNETLSVYGSQFLYELLEISEERMGEPISDSYLNLPYGQYARIINLLTRDLLNEKKEKDHLNPTMFLKKFFRLLSENISGLNKQFNSKYLTSLEKKLSQVNFLEANIKKNMSATDRQYLINIIINSCEQTFFRCEKIKSEVDIDTFIDTSAKKFFDTFFLLFYTNLQEIFELSNSLYKIWPTITEAIIQTPSIPPPKFSGFTLPSGGSLQKPRVKRRSVRRLHNKRKTYRIK
jgi:hypothetical protein